MLDPSGKVYCVGIAMYSGVKRNSLKPCVRLFLRTGKKPYTQTNIQFKLNLFYPSIPILIYLQQYYPDEVTYIAYVIAKYILYIDVTAHFDGAMQEY